MRCGSFGRAAVAFLAYVTRIHGIRLDDEVQSGFGVLLHGRQQAWHRNSVSEDVIESGTSQRERSQSPLKVAFGIIVPYGVLSKPSPWNDAFATVAHSIRKAEAKSSHKIDVLAILPDTLPDQDLEAQALDRLGLTARFVKIPVQLSEVKDSFARDAFSKVLGDKEELKYYGAGLTEYDRVVILDGDTMMLKPIDSLFQLSPEPGLVGTYDYEMDCCDSSFPPMNSGFGVFTPSKADFLGLADVFREGKFNGRGFRDSGTGYTYGPGSQGLLSFFYNQWRPGQPGVNPLLKVPEAERGTDLPGQKYTVQPLGSRFLNVNRSEYDVIQTNSLMDAVGKGKVNASRVHVMHFTGGCAKPWVCTRNGHDNDKVPLCKEMTERWWSHRDEFLESKGLQKGGACGQPGQPTSFPPDVGQQLFSDLLKAKAERERT